MLKFYKKMINFLDYLRKLPMHLYNQDNLLLLLFCLVKENKTKANLVGIIERDIFFFCLFYLRI